LPDDRFQGAAASLDRTISTRALPFRALSMLAWAEDRSNSLTLPFAPPSNPASPRAMRPSSARWHA